MLLLPRKAPDAPYRGSKGDRPQLDSNRFGPEPIETRQISNGCAEIMSPNCHQIISRL